MQVPTRCDLSPSHLEVGHLPGIKKGKKRVCVWGGGGGEVDISIKRRNHTHGRSQPANSIELQVKMRFVLENQGITA